MNRLQSENRTAGQPRRDRCLIMMATYNGEPFLRRQLDSILAQQYDEGDWQLIAQDDGSTDHTMQILQEYAERDPRIHCCSNETGNHGPYQNFNALFNRCRRSHKRYDLYLFADQDDLWDPDKLHVLTSYYHQHVTDESVPVYQYADMRIIDENGKVTSESLDAEDSIRRDARSVFFDASVWGCNSLLNRALFDDIAEVDDHAERVWGHDAVQARWAAIRGQLLFCPQIVFSYRRYPHSVTHAQTLNITAGRVLKRMGRAGQLAYDHAVMYTSSLFVLHQLRSASLDTEQTAAVDELEMCLTRGGFPALAYWIRHRISLGRRVRTISHFLLLFLGLSRPGRFNIT